MIFNGKGLDFLHGSAAPVARTPVFRFLLSGGDVRDEILDIQEQLGRSILDWLDEESPDWIEDAAEQTWNLVGGW
jgi:hypothetical protein